MRALTLWQPWAWLVANGHKLVENRPWAPAILKPGTRFAIHAGKQFSVDNWAGLLDVCRERDIEVPDRKMLAYGAIIATAEFCGVVDNREFLPAAQRPWFSGPYGWVLGSIRPLAEPVPAKGSLNLWVVEPTIAAQVLECERSAA